MSLASSGSDADHLTALLPRFLALISLRTGLQIRDKDRGELQRTLSERMAALKIGRAESYLQLLDAQPSLTQGEWSRLLPRLTNGESYFWRDKGQFSLLKTRLLPELIEARSSRRSLRIWSAGCSSGEEPYSLAMLVDELMPNRDGWNIDILGTDINPAALERARAGLYGAWAFRGLDIAVQEKYFVRSKGEFQIKPQLQSMVTFSHLNLRGGEFPSRVSGIYEIDLILCRNVLIYFSAEAISHTLQGFGRTLREGGYLLTGHAELANHDPAPLVPRAFAESVAYLKCAGTPAAQTPRPAIEMSSGLVSQGVAAVVQDLRPARPNFIVLPTEGGSPAKTEVTPLNAAASSAGISGSARAQALCMRARASADLGRHDDAIALCREASELDSTCDDAYFIWGQVESEQGRSAEAKTLFKKVIYLAPARFDAHLEMAALYDAESDASRARRERQAALEVLRGLPENQMLESQPGLTVGELRRHLEEALQGSSQANRGNR